MKKYILLLLLFAPVIFLSACATDHPPQIIGFPRTLGGPPQNEAEKPAEKPMPVPFTVFYRTEGVTFAKYEPAEGAYLAAWLMPEMGIRLFDYKAEKPHAVYVNEMFLNDEIPLTWLLQCIAARAVPLIIVHPPREEEDPELFHFPETELIVNLAKRLGSLNLPMFIAFYPNGHEHMTPAEFTLLFRTARNAFLAHAPKAAFIWVAPSHTATVQNPFFPGHAVADWVALPLLACWRPETGYTNILEKFEVFYHSFEEHKPIMLLPVGVSHFTRGDYTYRLNQAAAEITRLYFELKNFPRLGLIAYADAFAMPRTSVNDFSISHEPKLVSAYAAAVSPEHFLSSLESASAASRWRRSAFHGYVYEEEIFIPEQAFQNELSLPLPRWTAEINGRIFVESSRISEVNLSVCKERRVIFLE